MILGKEDRPLENFEQLLSEHLANEYPDLDEDDEFYSDVVKSLVDELSEIMHREMLGIYQKEKRRLRREFKGFRSRNYNRWKLAFEKLEFLIEISTDLGQQNHRDLKKKADQEEDYKFAALSNLTPRALLVAREVLCLLEGGFPDGALARWRSLHELAVTAVFIGAHDQQVASDYYASSKFEAFRSAKQYNQYADRAGLEPFSSAQMQAMEQEKVAAEHRIGRTLRRDYDWASTAFEPSKTRISFYDLEKRVELDHWRPRFRWASQHTHAGYRTFQAMLATSEAESPVILTGPSNSGFVDPLHMTAISLTHVISQFLFLHSNLDRIVYVNLLLCICDEIGKVASSAEQKTRMRHEKIKNRIYPYLGEKVFSRVWNIVSRF